MMSKFSIKKLKSGIPTRVRGKGGYKNINFEGVLCSSVCDGEKHYFTVNDDGVALTSYKENIIGANSDVYFTLKHKKDKNEYVPVEFEFDAKTTTKPPVIELVRHFRRWDNEIRASSNAGGLTVICILNYDTMRMQVFPGFCSNNDNFEKVCGLAAASLRRDANIGIEFTFKRELSVRENLSNAINLNTDAEYISLDDKDVAENCKIDNGFNSCLRGSDDGRFRPIL